MSAFYLEPGLRKLKGKVRKYNIFAFDIETYDNNKDFLMAHIIGKDYCKFFDSREKVYKELQTNRIFRNCFLFASNLSFDFMALFPDLKKIFEDISIIERNSSIIYAKTYISYDPKDLKFYHFDSVKKKTKEYYPITFCDSINHLKASVNDLGRIIRLYKHPTPFDLGNYKPSKDNIFSSLDYQYMKEYNKRDAEITYKFMSFVQDNYNRLGANLKVTISSSALDMYRRKYLSKFWKQEEREKIMFQYKGYYGGRTEAFKRGIFNSSNYGKVKAYDIVSLYPYCLRQFKYPIPTGKFYENLNTNHIDSFMGLAEVTLKAPVDLSIPLVPFKKSKLLFPPDLKPGVPK